MRLALTLALTLAACDPGGSVVLDVTNESEHTLDLVQFDNYTRSLGGFLNVPPGGHATRTAVLSRLPRGDAADAYRVTLHRSDGLRDTYGHAYYSGVFPDTLRLRVTNDSLIFRAHTGRAWVGGWEIHRTVTGTPFTGR